MDLLINGFVRFKYWVLSFFYTNEEILDAWIARQVLNLSPRKECTRLQKRETPKSKKISSEKPPPAPKRRSSVGSSAAHVGNNSVASPNDSGRYLYSSERQSSLEPCIFQRSTLGRNPSRSNPVVSCGSRAGLERYHPLGVVLGSEES